MTSKPLCLAALWWAMAAPAAVVLTAYNGFALLDETASTPLLGTNLGGDLVQLILDTGGDGPDSPNVYGLPGGDDVMLAVLSGNNPTHVGAGEVSVNFNLGVLTEIVTIDALLVGHLLYARFWNDADPVSATHYGNTLVQAIPAGDAFGNAYLDLVPLSGSPRETDTPFDALPLAPSAVVPEPDFLLTLGVAVCRLLRVLRANHKLRRRFIT